MLSYQWRPERMDLGAANSWVRSIRRTSRQCTGSGPRGIVVSNEYNQRLEGSHSWSSAAAC